MRLAEAMPERPVARRRGRPPLLEWLPPASLIGVALLLGGAANPLSDMAIELLALLVLLVAAIRFSPADWRRSRLGWWAILGMATLALFELLPLPFALWRDLPGRAGLAALSDALGLEPAPRPLSLDPNATLSTLIQTIPGIAAFTVALAAGRGSRTLWLGLVLAGAGLSVLLGSLQVTGQSQFYLYEHSNFGYLTGLFGNHNHAADMLLIGIAILAGGWLDRRTRRSGRRALIAGLILLFAIATLLTGSRFGISLLLGELALLALILHQRSPRRSLLPVAGFVVACLVFAGLLLFHPGVGHAIARFRDFSQDLRPEIWRQTLTATGRYWPAGSGLGTFVPVYTQVEQLDTMPRMIVNHAHNEYLELALELGLVGTLLIAAYLGTLGWTCWRRRARLSHPAPFAALLGILVLLFSSMVEFPLRNEALMVIFGMLNAFIFADPDAEISGRFGQMDSYDRNNTGEDIMAS